MSPETDKRDGYRAEVDRAVEEFAADHRFTVGECDMAKRVCYRTVWAESDWRNLANPAVPASLDVTPNDGYGVDEDSTGLYQQRSSQGWGSVIGSMDPYTATVRFLTVMLSLVPDWAHIDEPSVCQRVQRSQFDGKTICTVASLPWFGLPYPWAQNYIDRQEQTDALAADLLYFTHQSEG